jgi:hypothetical protein
MTMQVGMVGSDGIVLASDTLWQNGESTQWASTRYGNHSPKIQFDNKKGVAIACARNLELAYQVADELMGRMADSDWEYPENAVKAICTPIYDRAPERRREFQCTIAVRAATDTEVSGYKLFQLHAGMMGTALRWQPKYPVAVAGDTVNAAVFWAERYYSSWHPLRPIDELIPLAAHIVLSAGYIARGAIGGLEIIRCDKQGIRRLSESSISKLITVTNEREQNIQELIMGYRQSFLYDSPPKMSAETI